MLCCGVQIGAGLDISVDDVDAEILTPGSSSGSTASATPRCVAPDPRTMISGGLEGRGLCRSMSASEPRGRCDASSRNSQRDTNTPPDPPLLNLAQLLTPNNASPPNTLGGRSSRVTNSSSAGSGSPPVVPAPGGGLSATRLSCPLRPQPLCAATRALSFGSPRSAFTAPAKLP